MSRLKRDLQKRLSVFKPVGDELFTDVDIDLPELPITVVHKFMRHIRRDNNDLARNGFQHSGTNRKGGYAFLNNKDLFVRMLMQADNPSWRHVHPNKRNLRILIMKTLEFISIPISWQIISV